MKLAPSSFAVKSWPPAGSGKNSRHGDLFMEHVSPEGKYFGSRRELKDYCKKNGLSCGAIE